MTYPRRRTSRTHLIWIGCEIMTRDRYARPVGICYANHIDIGGAPDERGLAVAFRRYPDKDVANEERAHG
jgi:endonuclease YncB( thermonuclease family)